MKNVSAYEIHYLSENALSVEFGNSIKVLIHQQITAIHQRLQKTPFPGYIASVPAYSSLTIFFDPLIVYKHPLSASNDCDRLTAFIGEWIDQQNDYGEEESRLVEIPVCYGHSFGPDLDDVAALHKISSDELVVLHSQALYRVYMIGFVPGFTYLGGLNLHQPTPRRSQPRHKIPAGSVGLAGLQTGIYSLETPGGWQIIGRTPLKLFDSRRETPALLKAGDQVRFKIISPMEFNLVSTADNAD